MTDEQLTWIFQNKLSSHNGFKCCRLLMGSCIYPGSPRCEGQTTIIKGRLRYDGTCGQPCSFICDDADSLQKDIDTLLQYAKIVDEARRRIPDVAQAEPETYRETVRKVAAAREARMAEMREALERIRDFPYIGEKAAQAMALIARQVLTSTPAQAAPVSAERALKILKFVFEREEDLSQESIDEIALILDDAGICTVTSTHLARPKVIGRVTGREYDGDQVPGMPGAICHACGLKDYPCANPDCPNKASQMSSTKREAP